MTILFPLVVPFSNAGFEAQLTFLNAFPSKNAGLQFMQPGIRILKVIIHFY